MLGCIQELGRYHPGAGICFALDGYSKGIEEVSPVWGCGEKLMRYDLLRKHPGLLSEA